MLKEAMTTPGYSVMGCDTHFTAVLPLNNDMECTTALSLK